jgi:hypothetical protein
VNIQQRHECKVDLLETHLGFRDKSVKDKKPMARPVNVTCSMNGVAQLLV